MLYLLFKTCGLNENLAFYFLSFSFLCNYLKFVPVKLENFQAVRKLLSLSL